MARMPDLFHEAEEAVFGHLPGRHHHTSAAPAAATATIRTSTPGGPVSLLDEIETDVSNFAAATAAKFQAVDKEAIAAVEAIKGGNPAATSIFLTLASVAHLPDPMGILNSIDGLLKAFAPQQGTGAQPSFQPAGPVVAGQA